MGGISRFSVEKYLSDSAENFRGWEEFFRVSFISGIDKNWKRGGKAVSRFSGQNFLSHSAEKFSKETFSVSLISIMEKIFASEGYVTIFDFLLNFFLSHSAEKIRR